MSRRVCLNDVIGPLGNSDEYYLRGGLSLDTLDVSGLISAATGTFTGAITAATGAFGGASNFSNFEADGTLVFNGTGTVWDDLRVAGIGIKNGSVAPDLINFAGSATIQLYGFNGGGTSPVEDVLFGIQFPHGWKVGSTIYPHVHWCPVNNNSGTVEWSLEYSWASIDGVFDVPVVVRAPTQAAAGTAWTHQLASFAAIAGTGKGLSSMFIGRLFRDPGRDTYASDAGLLEFDIHYEIDTVGSRGETSK